jgi:uncharacterized DUF497 family protein
VKESKNPVRDPEIHFEWDPDKAQGNLRNHGVAFEEAVTMFQDPLAQSIPDKEHSDQETRWITQGQTRSARLLVASHTFVKMERYEIRIRLISARLATKRERKQYEDER